MVFMDVSGKGWAGPHEGLSQEGMALLTNQRNMRQRTRNRVGVDTEPKAMPLRAFRETNLNDEPVGYVEHFQRLDIQHAPLRG